jgi:vitamin B12 transporter
LTGFVESKKETYEDPFTGRDEDRNLVGIGAQYRAEIADQLYLSATLRHDDNDDFQDDDTYSAAASWIIPNTGSRPHASWGTGVTNPTFFEQFGFNPGSFIGNPDLKPEKAKGWDIGLEQTLLDGRLLVDLTYFESTLENEIYTAFGPAPDYLSTPANQIADSDRSGWELSFSARPTDEIDLTGSYTSLDSTEPAGIEVRRPKDQAALDASWRIGGGPIQLNLGVTYNGKQYDTDFGTFLRTAQDPYTLVRLGASYQLNDKVELYGRVENLMDEDYEEVIGYLGAPRGVFFGIRFRDGKGN